ncbi:RHS repeat-associated core domain-containing protein, partial [Lewinella lacunae]
RTSPTGAVTVQSVLDYYPFGMVNADRSSGAGGYAYKYNGKEFAEELGLSDYGARWYDPAVGRWLAVDPLALEYANFSPYNYVANNPINAIDPNGEYIIVLAGSAQDREFFINQINTLFGGNVNASFSSGGGSRLILEQTGALNEEQQVAFDIISGYANNEDEITVRLANNDKSINFESYDSREFDPSDFSAYSDNMKGSRSALSHYVHFFAEQYDRQVVQGLLGVIRQGQGEDPGKPSQEFLKSHEFALEQEALVSGVFTRDTDMKSYSGGIDLITFTNFDKNGKPVSTYQVWSGGEKGPKVSKPIPVNK